MKQDAHPKSFGIKLIWLFSFLIVILMWLSPLSFVPTPWPDDSAFYFVSKDFFKWPPRWVMIPQAPFEATYRIINFNTMPLYPLLIGIGKWFGIDGSYGLKFWPLLSWALTGGILVTSLFRRGASLAIALLSAWVFFLDPEMRWASFVVRPESLIGLFGVLLNLALTFGVPEFFKARGMWDPIAALLALAAYSHFNAIHLVLPVMACYIGQPKKLIQIAMNTVVYLSPWIFLVLSYYSIFVLQFSVQWLRLSGRNGWLNSFQTALVGLFSADGSPVPWFLPAIQVAAGLMWVIILASFIVGVIIVYRQLVLRRSNFDPISSKAPPHLMLFPSVVWVISSILLFHTKPERWFVYYIHLSLWCFVGMSYLYLKQSSFRFKKAVLMSFSTALGCLAVLFLSVDLHQLWQLESERVWKWSTYDSFIQCIDDQLTAHSTKISLSNHQPYRVWGPTPPDVLIELSRKHPDWEFTRTNDFFNRYDLAVEHGFQVEAMVVTEMSAGSVDYLSGRPDEITWIKSSWMQWHGYYLRRLWDTPGWKRNRYICQRGRWLAFLFMKDSATMAFKN